MFWCVFSFSFSRLSLGFVSAILGSREWYRVVVIRRVTRSARRVCKQQCNMQTDMCKMADRGLAGLFPQNRAARAVTIFETNDIEADWWVNFNNRIRLFFYLFQIEDLIWYLRWFYGATQSHSSIHFALVCFLRSCMFYFSSLFNTWLLNLSWVLKI